MTGNTNRPDWRVRLIAELKHDKKKTAVLTILLVVGLIVVGKLLLKPSSPSKAQASADIASRTAGTVSEVGEDDFPIGASMSGRIEKPRYVPEASVTISRDLFVPNEEYFPMARPSKSQVQMVANTSTQPAKDSEEVIRMAVQAQAQALSLQCTIDGARPAAIINKSMVRQGEWINGFEVVKITTRECTLRKNGVTVILTMRDANGQ